MKRLIYIVIFLFPIAMVMSGCKSAAEKRKEFLRDSLQRDSILKDSLCRDSLHKDSARWTITSVDLDANALKGPVHECDYTVTAAGSNNKQFTISFDEKGLSIDGTFVVGTEMASDIGRNEDKMITSATYNYNNTTEVTMDDEHRIVNLSSGNGTTDLLYDGNKKYPKQIIKRDEWSSSITTRYTYDKFDKYGNWTHCKYVSLVQPSSLYSQTSTVSGSITRNIIPYPYPMGVKEQKQ